MNTKPLWIVLLLLSVGTVVIIPFKGATSRSLQAADGSGYWEVPAWATDAEVQELTLTGGRSSPIPWGVGR